MLEILFLPIGVIYRHRCVSTSLSAIDIQFILIFKILIFDLIFLHICMHLAYKEADICSCDPIDDTSDVKTDTLETIL